MNFIDSLQFKTTKTIEERIIRKFFHMALYVPPGGTPFPKSIIDEPKLYKYIENYGNKPGDLAVLAMKDITIIGMIWGRIHNAANKGWGYIDEQTPEIGIAVLPKYRNMGIGTQLLNRLFAAYSDAGYNKLSLSVDKRNPSVQLYKRNGFTVVRNEGNSYVMKKG
jgi:ribosomal protein S18 acetylase RimI-like enzyme